MAAPSSDKLLICCGLIVLTLLVFRPVVGHDFVFFDDDVYVTHNPHIQQGLSPSGVRWAFTTFHAANWHPLTWLSHMLDVQCYGSNPAGHHSTSLILHAFNAALLFLVLVRMTGRTGASAFVAAVFAVHPLRVESVAWVSERKDLLSGAFWVLTLGAYARYAEKRSLARYVMVLVSLALGLMAKPMLVTLPFVLLLLDYWPLARWESLRATKGLLLEKVPLFALSAVSAAVTWKAQHAGGAIQSVEQFPFAIRMGNAAVSYVLYLKQLIWPTGLAFFYPHPGARAISQVLGATLCVLAVSAIVLLLARRRRYLPVGWFWYLGTLVPVIGLLQVGGQAMADRYTYLTQIGLLIMLVWAAADALDRLDPRARRICGSILAAVVLLPLAVAARTQLASWQNSYTLFTRALAVTDRNATAHNNLGALLAREGSVAEAERHFRAALEIQPRYPHANKNLANMLLEQGRNEEAATYYRAMLDLCPDDVESLNNLAWLLVKKPNGSDADRAEAVRLAERAVELDGGKNPSVADTLEKARAAIRP